MRERILFDAKQKSGTAPDGSIPIDIYGITGGGGGGADWGQIGGTLADQTDLKTALDGKATSAQGAKADSAVQPAAITGLVATHRCLGDRHFPSGSGGVFRRRPPASCRQPRHQLRRGVAGNTLIATPTAGTAPSTCR